MASISPLSTYKEQSNLYDAVAEKDANYVGKQIHAARKDLKISLEQFSQLLAQYGVESTETGQGPPWPVCYVQTLREWHSSA